MKFLVITVMKWPAPPEILPALQQAMEQWVAETKKSGKMEALYAIAGQSGGIGIANVDSLEELNDQIQLYPMTQFSEVQTFPLSDIDQAMSSWREQLKKSGIVKG